MKYVLFYETAEGGMAHAVEAFPRHQAWFDGFAAAGTLLMLGPFTPPPEDAAPASPEGKAVEAAANAMSVFTTKEAAEEFVAGDPFVLEGVVGRWWIREWREALVPE